MPVFNSPPGKDTSIYYRVSSSHSVSIGVADPEGVDLDQNPTMEKKLDLDPTFKNKTPNPNTA